MLRKLLFAVLLLLSSCTYDSSTPDEAEINDSKPLLLIEATGLPARRLVRVVYSDASGGPIILASASEKTDNDGRLLYPLFMARGTRNYSITLTYDDSNDGVFGPGDKATVANNGTFASDGETVILRLTTGSFSVNL